MSEPTTILGKIGKYTGGVLKALEASVQESLDNYVPSNIPGDVNVDGDIDGVNVTATGDLTVGGDLVCDSLLVKGQTKVVNTEVIELSDNIIELNKSLDQSATQNRSGIEINTGNVLMSVEDVGVFDANEATETIDNIAEEDRTVTNNIVEDINLAIASTTGTYSLTFNPDSSRLVQDIKTGISYYSSYSAVDNGVTYTIYPAWGLYYNAIGYRLNDDSSAVTDETRAYLMFLEIESIDSTNTLRYTAKYKRYIYTILEPSKPSMIYDSTQSAWIFTDESGTDGEIRGKITDVDGYMITIGQHNIGTLEDFEGSLAEGLIEPEIEEENPFV